MGYSPRGLQRGRQRLGLFQSKRGDQSIGVEADVSKIPDLQMLVDRAVSEFGRVDIMVNAGVETRTSILDTTEDQYERCWRSI